MVIVILICCKPLWLQDWREVKLRLPTSRWGLGISHNFYCPGPFTKTSGSPESLSYFPFFHYANQTPIWILHHAAWLCIIHLILLNTDSPCIRLISFLCPCFIVSFINSLVGKALISFIGFITALLCVFVHVCV